MLGDLILSVILLGISIGVLISTSSYPDFGNLSVIGPEFLPNIMSYFFIFAAAVLLVKLIYKAFVRKTDEEGRAYLALEKEKVRAAGSKIFKENFRVNLNVVITLLLVAAYGLLLSYVGYEILTAVFLIITMLLNGIRKPRTLILVPVLTLIAIYIVFVLLLKVQIPRLIF